MSENLHEHHRKRVREDFIKNGFSGEHHPHKLLEFLLFYSIPRKDTNEIAHRLLNRFGTLAVLLDAPISEITKVEGVGENTALLLKSIIPIARMYLEDKKIKYSVSNNINDICKMLSSKYLGFSEEVFGAISFNSSGAMQGFDIISRGDEVSVELSMRRLAEIVVSRRATGMIISHNHPNGFAMPSHTDLETTARIKQFLDNMNVVLIDHIILADNESVSLASSELYKYLFGK